MSARGTCTADHHVLAPCPDPECYRLRPVRDFLPAAIRVARERAGLTPDAVGAEIARQTGQSCGAGTVELYERGRLTPSIAGLRALADALGVSADELLGREVRDGERYPRRAVAARPPSR